MRRRRKRVEEKEEKEVKEEKEDHLVYLYCVEQPGGWGRTDFFMDFKIRPSKSEYMDNCVFSGGLCCGMMTSWSFPSTVFCKYVLALQFLSCPLYCVLLFHFQMCPRGRPEEGGMWQSWSPPFVAFHRWQAWDLSWNPDNETKRLFPEKKAQGETENHISLREGRSKFNLPPKSSKSFKSPSWKWFQIQKYVYAFLSVCRVHPSVCLSPPSVCRDNLCFLLSCGWFLFFLASFFLGKMSRMELRVASLQKNLARALRRKWVRRHHYSA